MEMMWKKQILNSSIVTSVIWLGGVLLCFTSAQAQVPQFQQTSYNALLNLRVLDPSTRQAAAYTLGKFKASPAITNALIQALKQDPDKGVRQNAAKALAKMGKEAHNALVFASICDPDGSVRAALAVYAKRAKILCHASEDPVPKVSDVRKPEAQLISWLNHPLPSNRLAAAKALAKTKSARGYRTIWQMASRDPVWSIRISTLRIITRAFSKKALSVIKFCLTRDPDARVRREAMTALAFIKDPKTVHWLANSTKFEPVFENQLAAIKALAFFADKNAASVIAALSESHPNELIRAAAVDALVGMKRFNKRTRPILTRIMSKDKSGKVRAAALRGLAKDFSPSACEARKELLTDPSPDVRKAIIEQLARCPVRIALPLVEKTAQTDRSSMVRKAAVEILCKGAPEKAQGALFAIVTNEKEAAIRKIAMKAVLALPENATGETLLHVAKYDSDAIMRRAAIRALAKFSAPMAIPALDYAIQHDPDETARIDAAKALMKFDDATAFQALQRASQKDASQKVRQTAAKGAAKSPAQKAWINSLLPQTLDEDVEIRLKAVNQLCPIPVKRAYRALTRALWFDVDPRIRGVIAQCFAEIDHPLIDIALSVAHSTEGEPRVVQVIEQAQQIRSKRLSQTLAALKTSGTKERVEILQNLYPNPNHQVRQTIEALLKTSNDPSVRRAAAKCLFRYIDRQAMQKLMQAGRKDQDAQTRQLAEKLYQKLQRKWSAAHKALNLPQLIANLRSKNRKVRLSAIYAIGVLRDQRAVASMKKILQTSSDAAMRFAAALGLALYGEKNVLSDVAKSEKDQATRDKLIQLTYLQKAPPEKVITAIQSETLNEVHRAMEAAGLQQLTKAIPWLVRLALGHDNINTRYAAIRTLALFDLPLSRWAIRVAATMDASKQLRIRNWIWTVFCDRKGS